MKLMQCAKCCFESIADNVVISHIYHAKQVAPFKTMKMHSCSHASPLKYYGGLVVGSTIFLQCHTDADFTISMAKIHLIRKDKYKVDDKLLSTFAYPKYKIIAYEISRLFGNGFKQTL
jgi:hypothetical protein